ncbi:MAG: TIGR03936 family radical SAM-associated protein [Elusimicrobiota bacterium]
MQSGGVKARICYSKEYPANLIGHLDTVSALQRSMRRAGWLFRFSCGFNPRAKLSFTPPLSLGFSSFAEYIEAELVREPEDYQIDAFKENTVDGITIMDVKIIGIEEPGINDIVAGFRYHVLFNSPGCSIPEGIDNIVERDDSRIVLDVYKRNGGFRNPVKILGNGDYKVKKIDCLWENEKGVTGE